ncbi:S-adenosyl-L-methionine-dependent methyltransferase [Marasmius fiardii PR-910]|nr:S-adenosyl-L-methionine-dependent methyltransferase [Marasmius fiardii PR-910]
MLSLCYQFYSRLLPHVLKVAPFNKETSEVMDFGCGNGFNASLVFPHVKSILGVDVSSGMVEEFNRNMERWVLQDVEGREISAVRVDLNEDGSSLGGRKFDVIFSCMVYHHLPSIEATTKTLAAYLKPGGYLLVMDWIKDKDSGKDYDEKIARIIKELHGLDETDMKTVFERAELEFLGYNGEAAPMDDMVGDYHLTNTAFVAWAKK